MVLGLRHDGVVIRRFSYGIRVRFVARDTGPMVRRVTGESFHEF